MTARFFLPGEDEQSAPEWFYLDKPTVVLETIDKTGVTGPTGTLMDGITSGFEEFADDSTTPVRYPNFDSTSEYEAVYGTPGSFGTFRNPCCAATADGIVERMGVVPQHLVRRTGFGEVAQQSQDSRYSAAARRRWYQQISVATPYSSPCYNFLMSERRDVLHQVMRDTGTNQSALSRMSGVRQSSISQFLSRKTNLSDEQLDRLLSCMGFRLEVVRRPVPAELTRSEMRSWRLHRQLATHLNRTTLACARARIEQNLARLRAGIVGEPHVRNLAEWELLLAREDVPGLHRVLTGLDRHAIEMREVSPLAGLLPQDERAAVLREAS
ncbi:helix-turn-helix domain-containing protein [Nocardia camponoti]|uniref:HTH cro/C1-type domain-containing protein n=1 Tax=Nocardia camponoti TaxID=1616106 RepID=A0A917Q7K8_9NOCA|nr:helix-turn-helix transcriptional regulator [Nocardia camponoti]GGK33735.1 hypothetical protein GCM10011591_01790 [Nocardia camponoti]